MNGTYFSDGAKLSFRDSGSGLPVVFLHPTPLDHDYWRPLTEDLAGVRAIVPDLRGHGQSELGRNLPTSAFAGVPEAPVLTMAQLATDVLALLDHLEIKEAVFAGCSIGGYVLLELWRRAPERMRGLAFVCSKPQPDAPANLAKRAANIAQARAGGVDVLFDGMAQSSIGATARQVRPEIVAELRARMTLTPEAAGCSPGRPCGAARFKADRRHHRSAGDGHCRRRGSRRFPGGDGGLQRRAWRMQVPLAAGCGPLCRL